MKVEILIYLTLLSFTFLLSIWCKKEGKTLKVFPFLLFISLFVEILSNIFKNRDYFIYRLLFHIYTPVEYSLLAIFFYFANTSIRIRKIIIFSIPVFVTVSLIISLKVIGLGSFIGTNDNIEGLLLISFSIITLFSIPFNPKLNILQLPEFWICVGILFFHSGMFFLNGGYKFFVDRNQNFAEHIRQFIIYLNYFLYIIFSIGFLCSNQTMKYSTQ